MTFLKKFNLLLLEVLILFLSILIALFKLVFESLIFVKNFIDFKRKDF